MPVQHTCHFHLMPPAPQLPPLPCVPQTEHFGSALQVLKTLGNWTIVALLFPRKKMAATPPLTRLSETVAGERGAWLTADELAETPLSCTLYRTALWAGCTVLPPGRPQQYLGESGQLSMGCTSTRALGRGYALLHRGRTKLKWQYAILLEG